MVLMTYEQLVQLAVDEFKVRMALKALAGSCESAYLYFQPGGENLNGKLAFFFGSETISSEWKLANGEALRSNVPYDAYYTWTWNRAREVRVLGYESYTHRVLEKLERGQIVIMSNEQFNLLAGKFPSNVASIHNPERCGLLDQWAVGTLKALRRQYPAQLAKLRPDLFV